MKLLNLFKRKSKYEKLVDLINAQTEVLHKIAFDGYINTNDKTNDLKNVLDFYGGIHEKRFYEIRELLYSTIVNIRAAQIHPKTFGPYKNKHKGQSIVLICGGPSVKEFTPIENAVYAAVNNSCQYDKVKFDYIFLQELHENPAKNAAVNNYEYENCTKFYGIIPEKRLNGLYPSCRLIPQSDIDKSNIKLFFLDDRIANNFAYDLTVEPIGDFGGTAFSAMQILLWTNPEKIYLVGADCDTSKNMFYNQKGNADYTYQIEWWKKFKIFTDDVYPKTEIISVNPKGLKGIFTDLYQENVINKGI